MKSIIIYYTHHNRCYLPHGMSLNVGLSLGTIAYKRRLVSGIIISQGSVATYLRHAEILIAKL